jgi:hypothetical protein
MGSFIVDTADNNFGESVEPVWNARYPVLAQDAITIAYSTAK